MFFQQLTKDPKDYHDVKSQPHAAVARRLNNSGKFHLKHGDIVKYIVCEVSLLVLIDRRAIVQFYWQPDIVHQSKPRIGFQDGTTNSAMQRVYHRTELESSDSLKIGRC